MIIRFEKFGSLCKLAEVQSPIVFNLFDVIVLLGTVQAGVIAFILIRSNWGKHSVILFSLILLTLAVLALKIELHTLRLWNRSVFRYFPLAVDTLLPVLLYAYLRVITGRPLDSRRLLLYLFPFLLFLSHALVVYLLILAQTWNCHKGCIGRKTLV